MHLFNVMEYVEQQSYLDGTERPLSVPVFIIMWAL